MSEIFFDEIFPTFENEFTQAVPIIKNILMTKSSKENLTIQAKSLLCYSIWCNEIWKFTDPKNIQNEEMKNRRIEDSDVTLAIELNSL